MIFFVSWVSYSCLGDMNSKVSHSMGRLYGRTCHQLSATSCTRLNASRKFKTRTNYRRCCVVFGVVCMCFSFLLTFCVKVGITVINRAITDQCGSQLSVLAFTNCLYGCTLQHLERKLMPWSNFRSSRLLDLCESTNLDQARCWHSWWVVNSSAMKHPAASELVWSSL